jgi:polyketide synthase PksN
MSQDNVLNRLVGIIESMVKLPAGSIDVEADFAELGINSLIVMELIESIAAEFEVTLTPAQFTDVSTVSELAELLGRLKKGASGEAAAQAGDSLDVLKFISQKYAVDLSSRELGSVDEMVDALVADHSEDLMRHYGMESEEGSGGAVRFHDIAIVGMSCRLPDASDARAFWCNLLEERNSAREVPASRWKWQDHLSDSPRPGKTVSKWSALIDDVDCFDAGFFNIPLHEARAMDPQQRLLLQEAYRAVEDAGFDMRRLASSNTGVFIGYQYSEYEQHLRRLDNGDMRLGPVFSSSSPGYYLANRISFAFDFRGPSESINVNCASSAVALNRAYYSLINGESDIALAGGVSLNLFAGDYIASSQYGLLSADGSSGVFDDDARGFTRGEGVAVVVLKRLEDAERDRDRIYAVIKSCHQNYRGAARSLSEVRHESITDLLRGCYAKASVDPATVRYIEVDGYARKWADSLEYAGIKDALRDGEQGGKRCALGSVKGNIGNLEAASAVTQVIKLALAMHHKAFPATISKRKISTFIDIDSTDHPLYIADKAIAFDDLREGDTPIRAGVNSFADSGTNVHILLEEYLARAGAAVPETTSSQLFVLSAKDPERLEAQVQQYIEALSSAAETESFSSLIYTSQKGREPLEERLAIVAASRGELLEKLSLILTSGVRGRMGMESNDIYRGSASTAERNPLADLITADMAGAQLEQSAQTGQWKPTALLWAHGVQLPWDVLWRDKMVRPASLPGYPFARDRYWIDVEAHRGGSSEAIAFSELTAEPAPPSAEQRDANGSAGERQIQVPGGAPAASPDTLNIGRAAKLALFLKQEAAGLLQKCPEDVELDKSLLDLGMSSIDIMELIRRIDALLGIHLSPSAVFKYPQIGTLSEYLAQTHPQRADALSVSRVSKPADVLVTVQARGDGPPIFALPGAGGNALSLQQLSHVLGSEQPFYCLEPVGLDGTAAPLSSVEEMAEFNIENIRSMQAKGPYRLLGYSNGGVVAFEMARRLLRRRARVSLIMVDSLCPTARGGHPVEEMIVAVFNRFASSLGVRSDLDVGRLRAVPESERSEYLYGFLQRLGVELPKQQFLASFNVATASEHACRAYRPSRLAPRTDVLLVKASAAYPGAPEDYGWGRFVAGPMRTIEIAADHFSIIEKGPAGEIAKQLAPAGSQSRTPTGAELEVSV